MIEAETITFDAACVERPIAPKRGARAPAGLGAAECHAVPPIADGGPGDHGARDTSEFGITHQHFTRYRGMRAIRVYRNVRGKVGVNGYDMYR